MTRCVISENNQIAVTTWSVVVTQCSVTKSGSNFRYTLDFADPLVWDLANQRLIIPLERYYVGIFTLLNTGGVTVNKIANIPFNRRCVFQPSIGNTVSLQHTLVGVAVAENLCCDAPSSTNTLVGRTDGCDFTEYERSGTLNVRTNLVLLA
jgi:hypothetical protein